MTFTLEQQMLCLAALTYRDFADAGPPATHDQRLRQDITSKLEALEPLQREWKLVWGPASYRAPVSLFDDAAMFVVQSTAQPNRYVVAVRGTNPISAFDWLFGDLWVSGQVPWPFDATTQARISFSTALGLDVLLQLRASAPPSGAAAEIWSHVEEKLGVFAGLARTLVLEPLSTVAAAPARQGLQEALAKIAALRLGIQGRAPASRLEVLKRQWSPEFRKPLIDAAAAGFEVLGGKPSMHMLALLEKDVWVTARLKGGHDLVSFMKAAVASAHGPVEVSFTGHSKGGALAPTLALWFAENQGAATGPAFRWDPEAQATVGCFHFAGPTAGNAAFAARSNATIGTRCHRIYNPLDVVPHAWVQDDMRRIGVLYDPAQVLPIHGLDSLAANIADVIEAQGLDYAHLGNHERKLETALAADEHDFVGQLIHQHLQAYIDAMGLGSFAGVDTFFNPLR